MTTFTIDGGAVRDIGALYDELNRVFMTGEDWRLGASLDALNDLLHGGFGALHGADDVRVVWNDHETSRRALGPAATIEYYREKLRHPETYSARHFRSLLQDLEAGRGATYFDVVLEVFADHPEIELILA
ncbi:barstar family protein [Microbacterium sp. P07]|uniref:barstar family protein n=1 Tax=Microbacterium sp. P07 TaxID=3366952 RepID=UPI0037477C8C